MNYNTNSTATYRQQILDYERKHADVIGSNPIDGGELCHKNAYPMFVISLCIICATIFFGPALMNVMSEETANIIVGTMFTIACSLTVSGCVLQFVMVRHLNALNDARRHTPSEMTYKELRGVIGCQYKTLNALLDGTRKLDMKQMNKLVDYFGKNALDMDAFSTSDGMADVFEWAAKHRDR